MSKRNLEVGDVGYLNELCIGQRAKVLGLYNQDITFKRRLFDMGITRGVIIELKKCSPMGDPVDILVRGYELCLRLSDMKEIKVEVVK